MATSTLVMSNDTYLVNSLQNKMIGNKEKKWLNPIPITDQPNHINGKSSDLEIPEKTMDDAFQN